MSSLFEKVNQKQIELKEKRIDEDLKDIATYAGIGLGAVAAGAIPALHQNHLDKIHSIEQNQPKSSRFDFNELINRYKKLGKVVDAKVDVKNKTITYIDEHGNKLVKKGGNISQLTNNPGNILIPRKGFGPKNWKKLQDMGAISYYKTKRNVYAVFPTEESGWEAVENWWKNPMRGEWTVSKAMHVYAPQIENDTENYIKYLVSNGIDKKDKLKSLSHSDVEKIVGLIRNMEGTKKSEETFIPAVKSQKVSVK